MDAIISWIMVEKVAWSCPIEAERVEFAMGNFEAEVDKREEDNSNFFGEFF